jgi:N utilization substance protein B
LASIRHRVRIVVLQTLFEADLAGHDPHEVLQRHLAERTFPEPAAEFARQLLDGVWAHSAEIDGLIAHAAPNWPLDQMARIDVNILRIAVFELLFSQDAHIPAKAAINEAVELAKSFGSDSSRRFVNGVLGTLAKEKGQ